MRREERSGGGREEEKISGGRSLLKKAPSPEPLSPKTVNICVGCTMSGLSRLLQRLERTYGSCLVQAEPHDVCQVAGSGAPCPVQAPIL